MASQPPTTVSGPVLGSDGQQCSSCGAELSSDQRYCLNCGQRRTVMRLPFLEMAAADAARDGATPSAAAVAVRGARSPLVSLGALIALLLALGIGVLIGRGNTPAPAPAAAAAKPSVITVAAPVAAPAAATAPVAVVSDWPAGTEAYTIALRTLPATATAVEATLAKEQATTQGATAVGVLRSDEFPSLTPSQIVVYSGSFRKRAGALAALRKLRAPFPDAKVVHVARTGAAGADAPSAGATPAAPKSSGLSSKDFQKRSKTIPDEVTSGGEAPPEDNQAPGDGTDATEIG